MTEASCRILLMIILETYIGISCLKILDLHICHNIFAY